MIDVEYKGGLTKDDVFGVFDLETYKRTSEGMLVATCKVGGFDEVTSHSKGKCPIFGDHIPYKSVTVACSAEQEEAVTYWLGYVHGGNSIRKRVVQLDGSIALRSDYQCW